MAEEILSLSTITKRVSISIKSKRFPKGKQYELRNIADLGPLEYATMVNMDEQLAELRKSKKKPTAAQERSINKMLDDSVTLVVLGLEPTVLAQLTDEQKQMIVLTWRTHVQSERDGAAEGNAQTRRRTTAG